MPNRVSGFLLSMTGHKDNTGGPNGVRTRVAALKGRCPRPLDDGTAQ